MILFPRVLEHFSEVLKLLFELRDIAIVFLMLLFKLDVRDFKCVILSNELRHLVLQGIDHRVVKLLLAFELLYQVLIHLPEIALIASGALCLTHVALGLFLLFDPTCIQLHPLSN